MNKKQTLILTLALLIPLQSFSESLYFKQAFEASLNQSPEIAAHKHLLRANELQVSRASLHWLPELGLKASAFSTNDPGSNFFGNLSQRSVQSLDFSPSTLNAPGYHHFQNLSLGLDLPLYEGGSRTETLHARNAELEASKLMFTLKKRELFVEVLGHYGNLVTDQTTKAKLLSLKDQVLKILSRYAIGNVSNPVGYSGILGLKGLNNRIDAEMISIETSAKTHQISLAEKTGMSITQVTPSETGIKEIILSSQILNSPLQLEGQSLMVSLAKQKEDALLAMKNAERSRFLPKIGLFGTESLTHGSRDTGYATTVGAYLAWSLFSPDSYHRVSEQEERKEAASKEKELASQESRIARNTLSENEQALEKTIKILAESDHILGEQVKVASRLFQSGSISALQLAEVYNRRADLILNLRQVEKNWIEVKGKKAILLQPNEEPL